MKRTILGIILIFCLFILAAGCSKKKNKVVREVSNHPPICKLVNIPPDGSPYSSNPTLYWYGTDPDGYVVKYQYLIIPEIIFDDDSQKDINLIPKLNGLIDSNFVKDIQRIAPDKWKPDFIASFLDSQVYDSIPDYHIPIDSLFVEDSVPSEITTRLFAELDTTKWVRQYIFVRAVDNENATSKIWKTTEEGGSTFRRFSRNNHPPKAHLPPLAEPPLPFLSGYFVYNGRTYGSYLETYCLPETTLTWKGFEINWYGSDSSDYPGELPPFLYKWELLGPFKDSVEVIDARFMHKSVVDSSYDSATSSRWVWDQSRLFFGLENYPEKKYGWYLFRVLSKDDALVESADTAFMFIKSIYPYFIWSTDGNRILLIEASVNNAGEGKPVAEPSRFEELRNIYKGHLENIQGDVGFKSFDVWINPDYATTEKRTPPDIYLMSLYDLIIVTSFSGRSGVDASGVNYPPGVTGSLTPTDYGYMVYQYYLDVGGKVWYMGIDNFNARNGQQSQFSNMNPFDASSMFGSRDEVVVLASRYFGIEGVYFSLWKYSKYEKSSEEFIGAEPFMTFLGEFPELEVDSARLDTLIWWDHAAIKDSMLQPQCMAALPGVTYEKIGFQTQRIYNFVSCFGGTSDMHGKPCASRYLGPNFKTAEFCFPLCFIKDDQAEEVMEKMLIWFFEE